MSLTSLKSVLGALVVASFATLQPALAQVVRFTPEQLREDFQIARKALAEAHGGIYRYASKAEIDRRFLQAERRLDTPTDARGFYRILQPAVASIACGHTRALLPIELRESLKKELLLPLDVKVLKGRVFILRDFAKGGSLAGQEIVSINGVPISRILRVMTAAESGDGAIPTGRADEVGLAFKRSLFNLLGMRGSFALKLADPKSGHRKTLTLSGRPLETLEQASLQLFPQDQPSKAFLKYSFLDEGNIAQLQIFNFNDAEADEDGASLFKKVFETIQAKGSQTLILDLRNNGGGEDALGKLLFSYLVDAPFSYYESLRVNRTPFTFGAYVDRPLPTFREGTIEARSDGQFNVLNHPNLGLQQPSLPSFRGRVFILINGGCFSTTSEFLTQAHAHRRATFIGEESGGGYFGNSSGGHMMLTLPHTKVRLVVPLATYYLSAQGPHPANRGVFPDYPVERTIADFLTGRDPELELALGLARKP